MNLSNGETVYLLDKKYHQKHIYNVKAFWSAGDGVQLDNYCFQAAVDEAINRGGYPVYIPTPDVEYKFGTLPADANFACVWIWGDGVTIYGDGKSSKIQLTENKDVAFHFSTEKDITLQPTGNPVSDFEARQLTIVGTGVYQNFSLAFGRGILFRNAKNVSVHHAWVEEMSMIGICSESGNQ